MTPTAPWSLFVGIDDPRRPANADSSFVSVDRDGNAGGLDMLCVINHRGEAPIGLSSHLVVGLLRLRNEIGPGRREDVDDPAIDFPDVCAVRDV